MEDVIYFIFRGDDPDGVLVFDSEGRAEQEVVPILEWGTRMALFDEFFEVTFHDLDWGVSFKRAWNGSVNGDVVSCTVWASPDDLLVGVFEKWTPEGRRGSLTAYGAVIRSAVVQLWIPLTKECPVKECARVVCGSRYRRDPREGCRSRVCYDSS